MYTVVKEEQSPIKGTTEIDSDDDDDSQPLSVRLKGISSQGNKGVSTSSNAQSHWSVPKTEVKGSIEDPDDEAPLSARFNMKSSTGTSSPKPHGSVEKIPLASKTEQNGSTMKDKQEKSSMLSGKRPLDKGNSSDQSSAKKPKISDTPTAMKSKQVAVKAEKDDEDDDHIPISQRMKKSTPVSKTSMKQKATNVVSSLKKINILVMGRKSGVPWFINGVIFPPPYKPHGIKMVYEARPVDLTPEQEEVATMFAVMKDTDYMSKPQFKKNFWEDWSKLLGRNHIIKDLDKCDFTPIYEWHLQEKEKKKQMSSEEKKDLKEEKLKQEEMYMWAIVDGVKEKVGNFRVEPPGLFKVGESIQRWGKCPIPDESWKDIKHDNTVTWLAFWNDPINSKEFKYVFLGASSSLKGQSDKEKYEKARMLKEYIKNIRAAYTKDFTSKDVTKRQISVATYLIDKLALRTGNEKDDDEADTVGCCTLKVGNVECIPPNKLKFDFLGKDSIQYVNTVEAELPVYKAIGQFQSGKSSSDDLFDKLDTSKQNAHLKELMPGLTAKVFRTYNASITLDEMLNKETKDGDVAEKVVIYQRANKEVAIICNHQRSVSKSHSAEMSRIIVAWCKRHEVPIEKIFNKSLLAKFAWAMDVDPDFRF
ncbi:hypothetical protein V6N12_002463 [Hibiscus sabdariffa]|uniref:DNA topoisomerase I n=1 Tax=Hibiscus sabdariffa TaxID=183260 RepID=A0ABR2B670_9ROSI